MKAEDIFAQYEAHTVRWLEEIKKFTPDSFTRSHGSEWSVAQVVDHICKTTRACVDNAIACYEGKGEKGHSGFGPAIFSFMGVFPPVRIRVKVPPAGREDIYTPHNLSQEEASLKLGEALTYMQQNLPCIPSADPKIRVKHWAGGWFNALQWYHSAEMHMKHHFRQLDRIKRQLS